MLACLEESIEHDGGLKSLRHEVERTCIVTRARLHPDKMIRLVLNPNNEVVPDIERKLPGRGVWITARKAILERATKAMFERGFKITVTQNVDLSLQIEQMLTKSALQQLSLANKAGAIICGFSKVEQAIEKKDIYAILHAKEAGEDGVRKISAMRLKCPNDIPVLQFFTSQEMDLALGRENVIHIALINSPISRSMVQKANRVRAYNALNGDE